MLTDATAKVVLAVIAAVALVAVPVQAQRGQSDLCEPRRAGEQCGPGNGRKTPGGGEKVSHKGWPAVTGILWKVLDSRGHRKLGGRRNDELLGHHGSDRISGRGGKDIIWGDWDPRNNNERQRDVLRGGDGNDWIYSSHGRNTITGGRWLLQARREAARVEGPSLTERSKSPRLRST